MRIGERQVERADELPHDKVMVKSEFWEFSAILPGFFLQFDASLSRMDRESTSFHETAPLTPKHPAFFCISQESRLMLLDTAGQDLTLLQRVETRVRESTHGRIRNLEVKEIQGRVVVRGEVPSHHTKQLALQGALELLSGDRCCANITVI